MMMKTLWDELDGMTPHPAITVLNPQITAFVDSINTTQEEQRLFQFLMGMNEDYAAQRSHILMFTPFPSVEEACSRIVQEESQREVLREEKEEFETAAMYGRKEEHCSVCGRKGHNKEKCWKVIGFPKWHPMAKKHQKEGEGTSGNARKEKWMKGKQPQTGSKLAAQAQMEDNLNFTGEQLVRLLKLVPQKFKDGAETEDEIDHSFAGFQLPTIDFQLPTNHPVNRRSR